MTRRARMLVAAGAAGLAFAAACRGRGASNESGRDLVISRVMVDPVALPDERGEWIEITNRGTTAADLRGWSLRSGNDAGFVVERSIVVPPKGTVIGGRSAAAARSAGASGATFVYSSVALGNAGDWLALIDPRDVTRDSLSWIAPPRGQAIDRRGTASSAAGAAPSGSAGLGPPVSERELVVRVLDVGQGDAILIQNGGSTVLLDGGPDRRALGRWLDQLGVRDTIDAVILSHTHSDHFEGLRELFASRRHLVIGRLWANGDGSASMSYTGLPDSIEARVGRGAMTYRDTDDPCGDGRALCTLELRGGARLHVMRPMPGAQGQNDRSAAVKIVGPDSASFTMWLGGDAERREIAWFTGAAGYARVPGMRADVLKADHHGSCDGVSDAYLDAVHPSLAIASLAGVNDYGHMHAQAKAAFARRGVPWYRTDQNGTITLRTPGVAGGGYTVSVERGASNADGPSDRRSRDADCVGM